MGIPKFFRYISERYPLTSQLIQENKIPEFDNLYLDFNGIIHNCSHPNDEDAHFRLSEEQIFTAIFTYVDHLFSKIKPKKLFFMAVDGVAPRAKMNQQRSRRFRTAKEAQEVREQALRKGEKLPEEKAFDSNCITPGTPFMVRLSEQLRYFVNKKITEDSDWQQVEVVLSGHEVPGEGEHKIMEYIRLSRAQPDYNPNIRHCLYGLDADLIMLGLLSHDPHFCLLREEVKFGPAKKKGNASLQSANFYLLHLSLMREYLNLEFQEIQSSLPFDYSLERVIDDFILLAVFVGNDFLPNLPDLHIHTNGLEKLFEVYKKVLPALDGYLNENGTINTRRLQVILDEMAIWEKEIFEKEYADTNWFKGKQTKYVNEMEDARKRAKLVLTRPQKNVFSRVKSFVLSHRRSSDSRAESEASDTLSFVNDFPARERLFIKTLADELNLDLSWGEFDGGGVNLVCLRLPAAARRGSSSGIHTNGSAGGSGGKAALSKEPKNHGGIETGMEKLSLAPNDSESANGHAQNPSPGDSDEWEDVDDDGGDADLDDNDDDEDDDLESWFAIDRVLNKYDKAPVMDDDEGGGFEARHERSIKEKMDEWKRDYYREKLRISYDDEKEMQALIFRYAEGLQWVMHYYYSGVASWGWFFNYHYPPRISDLRGVDKMNFEFTLGTPFRPFEQLMGVLPVASKDHIPLAYQDLMYDANSPILDFYPQEFESDLNGKKAEWEAIVKIPFINEKRLLDAMSRREHRLTKEEKARNSFGTSTKFSFDEGEPSFYPSSLPGFFPAIAKSHCKMEPFDLPTLNGLHLVPGLCDGVFLGENALAGFPSLKTLPYTATLGVHGVNIHGSESRNNSMVVHIKNVHEGRKVEEIADELVGNRIFFGWPFLQEGMVFAVSDSLFKYEKMSVIPGSKPKVVNNPHAPQGVNMWKGKAERIEDIYSKRSGVLTGEVEVLLHIRPLKGLKRLETGAFVKDYEGQDKELEQALQMCLSKVISEDPRYLEREALPIAEEFPEGSKVFFLGDHAYGTAAQVHATEENNTLSIAIAVYPSEQTELARFKDIVANRSAGRYLPSYRAADMLGISGKALSKITSSYMALQEDGQKINLGLSLKFEAKALKVIDYSKKDGRNWEFSEKTIELVREYKVMFPEVFESLNGYWEAMASVADIFVEGDPGKRLKEVKAWLKAKGVRDFEPVSLFCDQLGKTTVEEIEAVADELRNAQATIAPKRVIVKNIPRQAVLKPEHAVYRLQSQSYTLGDRVVMVQNSGSVPLSAKGAVIGINNKTMDVIWDNAFISGGTLSGRCSEYRGATVNFDTCLNLTNPQFIRSLQPVAKPVAPDTSPFRPRYGARPSIQPPAGQAPASGFRPAPSSHFPVRSILTNPHRGRGGPHPYAHGPWRGGAPVWQHPPHAPQVPTESADTEQPTQHPPRPSHQQRHHGNPHTRQPYRHQTDQHGHGQGLSGGDVNQDSASQHASHGQRLNIHDLLDSARDSQNEQGGYQPRSGPSGDRNYSNRRAAHGAGRDPTPSSYHHGANANNELPLHAHPQVNAPPFIPFKPGFARGRGRGRGRRAGF